MGHIVLHSHIHIFAILVSLNVGIAIFLRKPFRQAQICGFRVYIGAGTEEAQQALFLSQLNPGVKVVLRAKLAGKIEFSLLVFMDKPGNVIGDRVASAVYQRVQRFFPVLLFHAEVVQLAA